MPSGNHTASVSNKQLWAGHIVSALSILFLLMDGVMKLVKPAFVVEATVKLGYPESIIFGLGFVLTLATVLYAIPQTSVFGAILLTGTGVVPPNEFTLESGDGVRIAISGIGTLENHVERV